jgi:hypothetical protein
MPRLTELPPSTALADSDELYAVVGGNSRRVAAAGFRGQVFLTPQSTASGTLFDFTGIPAWASEINVIFDQVSLSGTDNILVQLGTAATFENTGYISASSNVVAVNANSDQSTAGYIVRLALATRAASGFLTIRKYDAASNRWTSSHSMSAGADGTSFGGGIKLLGGALTRVRITRTGSNTFDSGAVNVSYR